MLKQTMLVLIAFAAGCARSGAEDEVLVQDWQTICGDACAGAPVDVEVDEGSTSIRYEGGAVLCWGIRRGIDDRYPIEGWDYGPLGPSAPRPQIALVGYDENDPLTRPGILDAIDLGVHKDNACVVRRDGTLWCWGRNESGQLGQGVNNLLPSKWPVEAMGSERVASVAMGKWACAIQEDGTLGTVVYRWVASDQRITQCSDGDALGCLVRDGHVFCEGRNLSGALGNGNEEPQRDEVQAVGLENIIQVAVGGAHGCAIEEGGALWCWGSNLHGQVGREPYFVDENGDSYRYPTPAVVAGLRDIIQVVAGPFSTCAIQTGGQLFCWGDDNSGVLGTGSNFGNVPTPLPIPNADDIIDVSIAANHGCVIRENGEVACWGSSGYGAIGPEPGRVPYGELQSVRGLPHHGDWPSSD